MPTDVRAVAESANKLVERASAGATDYSTRAQAAGTKWASNAQAAKSAFQQGISGAGVAERFARGIAKAGAEKFTRKIRDVGAGRFAGGVAAGKSDYSANVAPYFEVIAGVTPPARQPRGSAANLQRISAYTVPLNAKRLAMLGVGGG